ncbi:NUDIX domain-containing protein [Virgibacillus halodenitrificans]|uniref:NUDIX hydrolase n=1 Tax=Virgibacillus halodenitrificans TaxID=1482 RepID=UPI00136DEC6A|nr:NUDIX hydrolase [Virgibacillus halodenitrificans]MYL45609.1 NUDIX domain-containing protein [Virgibacillus halodenitrificans]MYL59361.1 NUDIX domain-containing protein [Virgibacillus halodenitrificans]
MDATFKLENAVFNYRVAAIMLEKNHLLLHKQVNDNYWALPGGRVKVLEDSQASIKREIKEELDFNIKVDNLVWITENFFEYDQRNYHEIGLYYHVSLQEGSFTLEKESFYGEEGDRLIYKWIPLEDLHNIQLRPEFLKTALKEIPTKPEHIIIKD